MSDTNPEYDLFLSYNTQDHVLVTELAKQLEAGHTKVFLDRWHLIPGQPWPEHLRKVLASCKAVAVCVGPHEMGPWQQREMYFALERQHRAPGFPVIPVLLPQANPPLDFLSQNMWVDIRGGLDNPMALAILQAAIQGQTIDSSQAERILEIIREICPYRGLQYFREQDATFFFGREQAVKELRAKLDSHPLVALVGASGAGKSSVVRAGLLPSLRKDTEHPWEIITIVPGDRPLHNLAAALTPLLEPQMSESDLLIKIGQQAKALLDGSLEIRDIIEHILGKQHGTERSLLVVDQWEELYTLSKIQEDKTKPNPVKIFIDGLLDACEAGKLRVVLTLRGDFMGHVIGYRRLSDSLKDAQVNLSAMTQQELQQAIEQPALKLNTGFEPNLVDLLLTDVGEKSGNLPLLEFVLKRLWDDPQRADKLRSQTYRKMGRLKGALQQEADDLYDKLPSDRDRQQLRSLLLQLVVSNDANDYTRCRSDKDALDKQYGLLTQQLIDARLLVSNRDEKSGRNTLEVAHEALINDWPKLKNWLNDDIDFMAWRKRLNRAMDEQTPLKGQHLQDAKRWRKLRKTELNPQEIQFIRKSQQKVWLALCSYGLLALLPLLVASGFYSWAEDNKLPRGVAVDVLLAKYLGYVSEPEMVTIPPSNDCTVAKPCEFLMGSEIGENDERPSHTVHFNKAFKMGVHEVTFDEYQVFTYLINQQGGCPIHVDGTVKNQPVEINESGFGNGQHPAINVRWEEAQCYVQWLNDISNTKNYRLPSEAQWEYAARAGTTGDYFWDEQKGDNPKEYAWFHQRKTSPVGMLKANTFGLKDTAGNVWEWTTDCWHKDYTQAGNIQDNGKVWAMENDGDCSQRVVRGSAWLRGPEALRSAYRAKSNSDNSDFRHGNVLGFRLAQDLP